MSEKFRENVPGKFYVDTRCINCSICREIAPDNFKTNHEDGYEYVCKQPDDDREASLIMEAMVLCPVDAVKDNG